MGSYNHGWHACLNSRANHGRLNMYQLLYLLHEEAVLVNIGVRLLSNAGTSRLQRKKYTRLHSRCGTSTMRAAALRAASSLPARVP